MQESSELLQWYDRNHRELPWRTSPVRQKSGAKPNAYHVWLSEVMLQQTTVAAVKDYFTRFIRRWPCLEDLANSDLDDVLKEWAGLGYYSRARNLHKCAQHVASVFSGEFPSSEKELLDLPGVGPYTAAAITAIAFNKHAAVVDGNVERVLSRLAALETPLPTLKRPVKDLMGQLTPKDRPGDFAQAVMDLGATVCTARNPACGLCPWMQRCQGRLTGIHESLPRKRPKKAKPTRYGAAFVIKQKDGAVLLRKRHAKGLLGGMSEVPGTDWRVSSAAPSCVTAQEWVQWAGAGDGAAKDEALSLPFKGLSLEMPETMSLCAEPVKHTFTHFHLYLQVFCCELEYGLNLPENCWWSLPNALAGEALPTVFKKALRAAQCL
ncbi:A/G-specific adenine glycosylase [Polycladidibacter hongkongensis]|uniref:A/G-specific adenine glycosylase n=1 Tax=Polycladidibacter hongkongensis TaxID=1647556 RepID=UPI0008376091|nr:A/G-specific adenine glycosylase [Pseudovibrio hongkongensis]